MKGPLPTGRGCLCGGDMAPWSWLFPAGASIAYAYEATAGVGSS